VASLIERVVGLAAEHIAEIVRQVEEDTGEIVVLIVIDTLSRALCGGDENSPKDMGGAHLHDWASTGANRPAQPGFTSASG
jgi:hypothetical protein